MTDKIIITCALPYANGPLHVGHIRSTYLPADIYYRYLKLKNKDAAFVCSTDEHGTPITITAEKEGKKPIDIADKYNKEIKKEFKGLNIHFDYFSRTSTDTNKKNAQEFFKKADEGGYIYEKEVEQYYCENCKRFLPDRYVEGKCPECESEGARGDHCEKCGSVLEKLEEPECMICGKTPELKKTKHWFFKLTAFKKELDKFLSKKEIPPNVKNYAVTWLDKLQDWCISRDIDWGVPVPAENSEGKVLYVWWDAPIGYISATEEWKGEEGLDYWKNGKIVHFIGKDIIYHHALFWPAMLMAHGEYNLPNTIIAGEYLSLEGKKMSTSRDWVVWISDFLEKYPADYLRYYLTITSPLKTDMDFSWKDFEARVNNELSDVLGNFIHRVLIFNKKFFDEKIPKPGKYDKKDKEVLEKIEKTEKEVSELIENYQFMEALKKIMNLVQTGNQYLNEKEPWKNEDIKPTVTYVCSNIANAVSVLLNPFLPETAEKIRKQLGFEKETKWKDIKELEPGHRISKPEPLIEKVEIESKKD
ncbi:MAG: methionine--tRNA ligase [Candidatus Undinarchaeales archaeon]